MLVRFEMLPDRCEEGIEVLQKLVICEAKDPEAEGRQVGISVLVMGFLPVFFMNAAVQLQHEPPLVTVEIDDVRSNRLLATEFEAEELAVAQPVP